MLPQVSDLCMRTVGRGKAGGYHHDTNQYERTDGDDLNHGEPELDLTEVLHRGQVQRQQRDNDDECGYCFR